MVPRIQQSNLRALSFSGVSRENAKYISLSLSLFIFLYFFSFSVFVFVCWFVFYGFFFSFVFEKKDYNTLLFLTFIKNNFLLFPGGGGQGSLGT